LLDTLHGTLSPWEVSCPEKTLEGKHIGNTRIHSGFDKASEKRIEMLKGTPEDWTTFVSRHARDYTFQKRYPDEKIDFTK